MRKPATFVATVAAAAAIVALGGCGTDSSGAEDGGSADAPVYGVGDVRAGSSASIADCEDWIEGTEEEQQATVDDLYNQVNQAGADGPTPDLADEAAFELFDKTCAQDYAAGFRLYKLYIRSAAFDELPVDQP